MPMRREQIAAALKYVGDRANLLGGQQSPEQSERQRIEGEIRQTPWFKEFVAQYKEEPDLSPNADYDYVTAWKAGVRPERDPYDQNRFHWASKTPSGEWLKAPNHPTRWKETFMEQSGVNPDALGLQTEQQGQEWLRTKGRK
jgi:hypothetical protein